MPITVEIDIDNNVEEVLVGNGPDNFTIWEKQFVRDLDWRHIGGLLKDRLEDYALEWIQEEIENQLEEQKEATNA